MLAALLVSPLVQQLYELMSERAHNAAMFSKYNVYRVPCLSKCKYMAISQIIEQNSKLDGGWCLMKGQGKLLQFIPMNGH